MHPHGLSTLHLFRPALCSSIAILSTSSHLYCLLLTSWLLLPCKALTCMLYIQLLGARAWKAPVLALLAINTAIAMKQTDGFLSTKLVDPTYAAFPGRMDTTIAGACSGPLCCCHAAS